MTTEQAATLRAPFAAELVGKLPKPTKKDAPRGHCKECGGYHGLPAVHLDYVGHAAVTDRLLQVDPGWTWEPLAVDQNGLPKLDEAGNLWIKLTVAGVTRLGYGDSTMGHGMKEKIGDALRNAAMRFGVALDLWSKEDLRAGQDTPEKTEPEQEVDRHPFTGPKSEGADDPDAKVWLQKMKAAETTLGREDYLRVLACNGFETANEIHDPKTRAAILEEMRQEARHKKAA